MENVRERSKRWQAMEWEHEFRQQVECDDLEAAAFAREAANMYARMATLELAEEILGSLDLMREDVVAELEKAATAIRFLERPF